MLESVIIENPEAFSTQHIRDFTEKQLKKPNVSCVYSVVNSPSVFSKLTQAGFVMAHAVDNEVDGYFMIATKLSIGAKNGASNSIFNG